MVSAASPAPPFLSKDRLTIGVAALLVSVSVTSWGVVFYEMPMMTMASGGMSGGPPWSRPPRPPTYASSS